MKRSVHFVLFLMMMSTIDVLYAADEQKIQLNDALSEEKKEVPELRFESALPNSQVPVQLPGAELSDAERKDRKFGELTTALPTALWVKMLTFLLGPNLHVWFSVDKNSLPPWQYGSECGVSNGGRITTYNKHCIYSWYPHKNVWSSTNPSGLGESITPLAEDTCPIAFGNNTVTLAHYRDNKIEILDSATLKPRYTHNEIDPALAYFKTNAEGNIMAAGDHPLLFKAVMRRLVISRASKGVDKKVICIPEGAMPPLSFDTQGRYCAGLHAESESVWIADTQEAKIIRDIELSDRCLKNDLKKFIVATLRGGAGAIREVTLKRRWQLVTYASARDFHKASVIRVVDLLKYVDQAALYDHKSDVITVLAESQKNPTISGFPSLEYYGCMASLDSHINSSIEHCSFINSGNAKIDPTLLTIMTRGQWRSHYEDDITLIPLDTYKQQPDMMKLALWNIGDGKEQINKAIPLPCPGIFACATNGRGRLFCTQGDCYSIISDVRVPKQLENMEWKFIDFGIGNGFSDTIPLRRVQQPLMSQSGDWVLVREKQVKWDEKQRKQKWQYIESHPTMIYLGLRNAASKKCSPGMCNLVMRLYALQKTSEPQELKQVLKRKEFKAGQPVPMPSMLQKAITPPLKQDDCVIA